MTARRDASGSDHHAMDTTEPVRWNLYLAALVVALSTIFGALALVDPFTLQAVFGAVGAGLAQFALIAFGAERARSKVTPV